MKCSVKNSSFVKVAMKECMLKESVKQKEKKSKQVAITRPTRLEIQSLEEELAFLAISSCWL